MSAAGNEIHVFWLAGMSCEGCTAATLTALNPALEELVGGALPDVPPIRLHHPTLSEESGARFLEPLRAAADGRLGAPFVVVLEGSVPDDLPLAEAGGFFSALGIADGPEGRPARMTDWLKRLAPSAAACVAIGTCATWGGIPAAAGNITGSMSLMDFLGGGYRSARGIPVVNVPGCAPVGDNFTETLMRVLRFIAGAEPLPQFDELGRPAWLFGQTVHRHCPKAGYYEEGVFAPEYGDDQCLLEVGCWGPVVQCNIVERGAINHVGGCMVAGGPCIGCTMPGFPDKYSPFYKAPPGSTLSGSLSKVYGSAIRRLRRMSMRSGNREPLWDNTESVPSAWAREKNKPALGDKAMGFFYKRLQYRGSVHQGERYKHQPVPKSLDILRQEGIELEQSPAALEASRTSEDEG